MTFWLRGLGLASLVLMACSMTPVSRFPVETIPVPEPVAEYASAAQPEGAAGAPNASQLAVNVAKAMAGRGQRAEADGTLASTACWALQRVHQGHLPDTVMLDAASRRYGFGGVVASYAAFDVRSDAWRDQLERVPANMPLNRFGVCTSPSGQSAAIVLGAMEMDYTTIAKDFEPGQQVTMRGRVGSRFTFAHVYLTKSDGSVEERRTTGQDVNVSFPLEVAGQYRLEVMGDSPATGPVIVSNMPLYVGVSEPPISQGSGVVVEPEVAEARMLTLLNEARKTAGVGPLQLDPELRKVAEGHSEDMHDHNFFSHVSPSTGTPENRLRSSGMLLAMFGENIAFSPTPEDAHTGLMQSPGHRANMVNAKFTHVGIAAVSTQSGIIVTLNFGRRPTGQDLPKAEQILATFVDVRRRAGLTTPPSFDPVYSAGAQAGADAMAAGAGASDIAKAEGVAMQRAVDQLRTSRTGSCELRTEVLELDQLEHQPALLMPELRRFGIGTHVRRDEKGVRVEVVLMLEGSPCR